MKYVLAGIVVFAAGMLAQVYEADAAPPNIVLILGDDQAWSDYGFMGHDTIRTPHLDALAEESVTFTRGYVVTSLCRPSLATLATGLYPHQHRITGNDPTGPRPQRTELNAPWLDHFESLPRIAALLGEAGYVSHQSGKWWEGNPVERGGFSEAMTHGDPERGGRHGDAGLTIGREGMDPVFDFIDGAEETPFFLWYAPFLPHLPHNPPERLLKEYLDKGVPEEVAPYYAMCTWFDETCGALIDGLEERGIRDNTLILFLADNGWIQPTTNNPAERKAFGARRGKRSPYDGGLRTPITVLWPGHTTAERVDTPVNSIDVMPTFLAAAGVEIPSNLPGINLLDRDAVESRGAIHGEVFAHDMADFDRPGASLYYRWIVDGSWKLIVPHDAAPTSEVELFRIVDDPWERENVADGNGDVVERLRGKLDAWWMPN